MAKIDVYDATAGTVLASQELHRSDFLEANSWRLFQLSFTGPGSSHSLEFRTYYKGYVQLDLDKVQSKPLRQSKL